MLVSYNVMCRGVQLMRCTGSTSFVVTLMASYLCLLLPSVCVGNWLGTAMACAAIVVVSRHLKLSTRRSLLLVCAGYVGQDLSHWLAGEATFQASYSGGGQVLPCSCNGSYFVIVSFFCRLIFSTSRRGQTSSWSTAFSFSLCV